MITVVLLDILVADDVIVFLMGRNTDNKLMREITDVFEVISTYKIKLHLPICFKILFLPV